MERSILAEPMTAMPDFADLVPREPNGHFSNAALAAKSARAECGPSLRWKIAELTASKRTFSRYVSFSYLAVIVDFLRYS